MKNKTLILVALVATAFLNSCAPQATINQGGATSTAGNCSPSRGSLVKGGNTAIVNQSSNWSFSLVDVTLGGAAVGRPPVFAGGYGQQQQPCPPGYGGGRPPEYQPQPCPPRHPGYSGPQQGPPPGYRPPQQYGGPQGPPPGYGQQPPPRRGYPGHASNPIVVNGVAFSDQYPGGTRVAPPR